MAPSTDEAARLRYLNDSAHLLASTSPRISAHLITKRNLHLTSIGGPVNTRDACHKCGTIFRHGINHIVTNKRNHVVSICQTCKHTIRLAAEPILPIPKSSSTIATPELGLSRIASPSGDMLIQSSVIQHNLMAVNKKSAHERKKIRKQSGLQALLANRNEQKTKSGSGLDLMDLMRKGWSRLVRQRNHYYHYSLVLANLSL